MALVIACPLVLPDVPLDLAQLEAAVHTWGLAIQREALAQAWPAQAGLRRPPSCPACQGTAWRPAGSKPRQLETVFGPVCLPRQRVCCRACGHHFPPDDAVLAPVLGSGRGTPALRELAASGGASWPDQQAARVVGRVRGAPLSAETIRQVVAQPAAWWRHSTPARRPPPATPRRPPQPRAAPTAAAGGRAGWGVGPQPRRRGGDGGQARRRACGARTDRADPHAG